MSVKKDGTGAKTGKKPRPPGAGWVVFEVSPAALQHLRWLIPRSGLGETPDEVAQSLFKFEVQESMKDPKRHTAHESQWYVKSGPEPADAEKEKP